MMGWVLVVLSVGWFLCGLLALRMDRRKFRRAHLRSARLAALAVDIARLERECGITPSLPERRTPRRVWQGEALTVGELEEDLPG